MIVHWTAVGVIVFYTRRVETQEVIWWSNWPLLPQNADNALTPLVVQLSIGGANCLPSGDHFTRPIKILKKINAALYLMEKT